MARIAARENVGKTTLGRHRPRRGRLRFTAEYGGVARGAEVAGGRLWGLIFFMGKF
jgi:hypothetical protein